MVVEVAPEGVQEVVEEEAVAVDVKYQQPNQVVPSLYILTSHVFS